MKFKIAVTIVIALIVLAANAVYLGAQGPIESSIAVKQIEDDATTYAIAQKTAEGHMPNVFNGIGLVLIGGIWIPSIIRNLREHEEEK